MNLPVAIIASTGWERFYRLSETRTADWGSIWYYFETEHWPFLDTLRIGTLNVLALAVFVAACLVIALIILAAPRRPRLPQVFFLTLAAFLLTNKVWSPQYVIWLVPLVVLARPRLWSYLLWQAAEVGYFFAIWAYLVTLLATAPVPAADGGIGNGVYFVALLARFVTVTLLCVLVIKDILRPRADVVRAGGEDNPGERGPRRCAGPFRPSPPAPARLPPRRRPHLTPRRRPVPYLRWPPPRPPTRARPAPSRRPPHVTDLGHANRDETGVIMTQIR